MKSRLNKLYADNRRASARRFAVVAKEDSAEVEIFLYDQIVSMGEIISTRIVAAYLTDIGVPVYLQTGKKK
ncbi:MAG: hypothetical protein EOO22_07985 [Comamonadaceae bacterium]|nr:MAG: hypothetical protein EOO22_07985 [Comamonadaceae bacterium]